VQVKGGHVKVGDVRDLVGTLSRESAEMGVFLTLEEPTAPMKAEAATAGMYQSPGWNKAFPKVQILTIAELLGDPHRPHPRCLQMPDRTAQHTLPDAPRHAPQPKRQGRLEFE
jgi:site-specific DNA-methyltransferase (adenine-specific)